MMEPTAAPSRPARSGRKTPDRARRSAPDSRSAGIRQGLEPAVDSTGVVRRRAPSLRRPFPVLEPEREAFLRGRNRVAFTADPRRVELERRLLDLGGVMALLFLPDPQIGELLERGRYFPGARALMRLGEPASCHANAAMMFVQSEGEVRVAIGLCPLVRWPVAAAFLGDRRRGRAHPRDDRSPGPLLRIRPERHRDRAALAGAEGIRGPLAGRSEGGTSVPPARLSTSRRAD